MLIAASLDNSPRESATKDQQEQKKYVNALKIESFVDKS